MHRGRLCRSSGPDPGHAKRERELAGGQGDAVIADVLENARPAGDPSKMFCGCCSTPNVISAPPNTNVSRVCPRPAHGPALPGLPNEQGIAGTLRAVPRKGAVETWLQPFPIPHSNLSRASNELLPPTAEGPPNPRSSITAFATSGSKLVSYLFTRGEARVATTTQRSNKRLHVRGRCGVRRGPPVTTAAWHPEQGAAIDLKPLARALSSEIPITAADWSGQPHEGAPSAPRICSPSKQEVARVMQVFPIATWNRGQPAQWTPNVLVPPAGYRPEALRHQEAR